MHVVETDQDQLKLLEESTSHDSLNWQDLLEQREILLQSLLEKALGQWELIDYALQGEILLHLFLSLCLESKDRSQIDQRVSRDLLLVDYSDT